MGCTFGPLALGCCTLYMALLCGGDMKENPQINDGQPKKMTDERNR